MFILEKKNKENSVIIQMVRNDSDVYKVVKTIGCATTRPEIEALKGGLSVRDRCTIKIGK